MINMALWITYAATWLMATPLLTRWAATEPRINSRCHARGSTNYRSICNNYHGEDCWRPVPEVTLPRFAAASVASLAWPLLILPAMAWWITMRKPLPPTVEQMQKRLAELEREAGIR